MAAFVSGFLLLSICTTVTKRSRASSGIHSCSLPLSSWSSRAWASLVRCLVFYTVRFHYVSAWIFCILQLRVLARMSDLDAATGLLRFIANTLSDMVKGVDIESRQLVAIILIVWASAIFSAFVDNIPFTATMVPVMLQVSETSLQETLLWRCRLEIYFANVAWKFMFLWTL